MPARKEQWWTDWQVCFLKKYFEEGREYLLNWWRYGHLEWWWLMIIRRWNDLWGGRGKFKTKPYGLVLVTKKSPTNSFMTGAIQQQVNNDNGNQESIMARKPTRPMTNSPGTATTGGPTRLQLCGGEGHIVWYGWCATMPLLRKGHEKTKQERYDRGENKAYSTARYEYRPLRRMKESRGAKDARAYDSTS